MDLKGMNIQHSICPALPVALYKINITDQTNADILVKFKLYITGFLKTKYLMAKSKILLDNQPVTEIGLIQNVFCHFWGESL